jgi:hypothetical protein
MICLSASKLWCELHFSTALLLHPGVTSIARRTVAKNISQHVNQTIAAADLFGRCLFSHGQLLFYATFIFSQADTRSSMVS